MDINFHYFAVKTLALAAGFPESEAQTIANFSQYIDDFDWITTIQCDNIPKFISDDKECDLVEKGSFTNFNPAMTGFVGLVDMSYIATPRGQKLTVSPFHFIPPTISKGSNNYLRTMPATPDDNSIISTLLKEAKTSLLQEDEPRHISLMRIGMYLHIFADTYAHQLFTGYKHWQNDVIISKVINIRNNKNITSWVGELANRSVSSIGHANAGHTPDLTYVEFTMKYKSDEEDAHSLVYARSNSAEFLKAAQHIYNYLRSCRGSNAARIGWEALSARIKQVFLFEYYPDKTDILAANWKMQFPSFKYKYDRKKIEESFKLPTGKYHYTDEFYWYNYIADKLLIKLYGPNPRKG